MELRNIEFYTTPEGEVMMSSPTMPLKKYEVSDVEFTEGMLDKINTFYPDAHKELCEEYNTSIRINKRYVDYLMVKRFIKCNFSQHDDLPDIDADGFFRLEFVPCPFRGECALYKIVCRPKFKTDLSYTENEVMRRYFRSMPEKQIAAELHISIHTVRKHKGNAFKRVGISTLGEFNSFAAKTKMYDTEE